jgi:hypothetical protein
MPGGAAAGAGFCFLSLSSSSARWAGESAESRSFNSFIRRYPS